MSSFSNNTNFDNLLLQSLIGRLQIRPPNNRNLPQSLEDLLFDAVNLSDNDDENDENKTQLAKEESKLEKEIIRIVLSGNTDSLKPNSGQAVAIGEHHICVGFHEEKGSDYRVWEWHGHIMLFDEENGYTPEYIYGNYFQRLQAKARGNGPVALPQEDDEEDEEEEVENVGNLGLRELINGGDSGQGRILHRNRNAGSTSVAILLVHVYFRLASGGIRTRFMWVQWRIIETFYKNFNNFVKRFNTMEEPTAAIAQLACLKFWDKTR